MKKLILSVFVALTAIAIHAQVLPKPSPLGEIEQIVGVTEIEIEYSRPGVKDRVIFGELLPYGEIWRFGANAATKFETEDALHFGSDILEAGEYAVLAIPEKENWQIIFSKDLEVSEQTYSEENDVLRLEATPTEHSFTETFTLDINDIRHASASFVMLWENTKISVPFKVMTNELAEERIQAAIEEGEELGDVYQNAANFYYGSLKDYERALEYVEMSFDYDESYRNLFMKARILEKLGNQDEAVVIGEKALSLAKENASQGYIDFISNTISKWKE